MMDALKRISEALSSDPLIAAKVETRIKYYVYPDTADVTKPYVVIDPLRPPVPDDYADNDWMTETHLIQIDVWAKTRADKDLLGNQIQLVMREVGFYQSGSGVDEYDKDVQIYRDGRRYWANFTETTYKKGRYLNDRKEIFIIYWCG